MWKLLSCLETAPTLATTRLGIKRQFICFGFTIGIWHSWVVLQLTIMWHLFAKLYQSRPIRFKWKVHNFEEKNEGSTVLVLILLLLLGRMLTGLWSRLFKEKSCLPPDQITMMKIWGPDDQFCHYLEQNMNSSILPHFILSTIISSPLPHVVRQQGGVLAQLTVLLQIISTLNW